MATPDPIHAKPKRTPGRYSFQPFVSHPPGRPTGGVRSPEKGSFSRPFIFHLPIQSNVDVMRRIWLVGVGALHTLLPSNGQLNDNRTRIPCTFNGVSTRYVQHWGFPIFHGCRLVVRTSHKVENKNEAKKTHTHSSHKLQ